MTVSGWAEIGESQSPAKMADIAVSLSSVRNFSWLVGIVLIVGVSANAYLVWLSARRRLSVRWETFSLILRYSSVVDMSLCVLLDSFVMWSSVVSYARSDMAMSFQCGDFKLECVAIYCGFIVVSSWGIVAARKAIMLFTFEPELAVLQQNRMRLVTVLRDLAVSGVVCYPAWHIIDGQFRTGCPYANVLRHRHDDIVTRRTNDPRSERRHCCYRPSGRRSVY